jgi:TfoX/Sxy family transcriptional regulator of competence genes
MRRLSVLLEEELLRWPDVAVRSMFGMRAFYRKETIFALLPATKMIDRPNAIAYKFAEKAPTKREGHKWQLFDVENEASLAEALQTLQTAYRKAATKRA